VTFIPVTPVLLLQHQGQTLTQVHPWANIFFKKKENQLNGSGSGRGMGNPDCIRFQAGKNVQRKLNVPMLLKFLMFFWWARDFFVIGSPSNYEKYIENFKQRQFRAGRWLGKSGSTVHVLGGDRDTL
jgi:hypothetical protein